MGIGVASYAGDVALDGVAIRNVFGVGVVSSPARKEDGGGTGIVHALDLFVSTVRSATIELSADGTMGRGGTVAYGLHAGPECTLSGDRVTLDSGGYGIYNAGGTIAIRVGSITRQLDGAGAFTVGSDGPRLVLENVARGANASDEFRSRGDLPSAAALSPPTAICTSDSCP